MEGKAIRNIDKQEQVNDCYNVISNLLIFVGILGSLGAVVLGIVWWNISFGDIALQALGVSLPCMLLVLSAGVIIKKLSDIERKL
jgi:hypothetical protein